MKFNKLEEIAYNYAVEEIDEEVGSVKAFAYKGSTYILKKTNENEFSLYKEFKYLPVNVFYL